MDFFYDGLDSDDERFALALQSGAFDDDMDAYSEGDYDQDYDHESDEDEEDFDDYGDDEDDAMEPRYARRAPPPPAPLAPPPLTLCRFFVLGKCRYGSRCTFSHALPTATANDEDALAKVAATMVDCPYFQRGNCKFGQRCRLRHAPPATTTSTPSTRGRTASTNQQEFTCGICFEDIVEAGKHFGLLSCDHCFCLDCLRSWRQSKDMEAEVTRACPACRVPSNYIVPSLKFCTGDEKKAVVDAYKRHLAIRECKYFDGTFGSCPFGSNCFYAHRNSAGDDVKHLDRVRRRRRRSNSIESFVSSITSGSRRGGRPEALGNILERYNDFFRFLESLGWEEDHVVRR